MKTQKGTKIWDGEGYVEKDVLNHINSPEGKTEPPYIILENKLDSIDKRNNHIKNRFTSYFMENRKTNLEEAKKAWKKVSEAKFALDNLLEMQKRQVVKWKKIHECLRVLYMNQPTPPTEEQLQKTVDRYKVNWQREQTNMKARKIAAQFDPEEDLRKRLLDPKTRKSAIEHYLLNRGSDNHFLFKTLEIIFGELDKLKRR